MLGGAQSLHTNGMDEAFAIPTEEAMQIALRTQQIIADEIGVANVVDPLGGSYFVESLTTQYETRDLRGASTRSTRNGGTIKLIEEGWFQRRIADFAYDTALQEGERREAGHRRQPLSSTPDEKFDIELHPYDPSTAERQIERLKRVRRERDNAKVSALLDRLVAVAKDEHGRTSCRSRSSWSRGATMGDIVDALKTLWGTYRETRSFSGRDCRTCRMRGGRMDAPPRRRFCSVS